MIILLAGIQGIPDVPLRGGQLDGAGAWGRFRYVTLPALRPAVLFVVVIATITGLQLFDLPYVMTGGGPLFHTESIVEYLYQRGFVDFDLGYAAAIAWVLFLLIMAVSLLQLRLLRYQRCRLRPLRRGLRVPAATVVRPAGPPPRQDLRLGGAGGRPRSRRSSRSSGCSASRSGRHRTCTPTRADLARSLDPRTASARSTTQLPFGRLIVNTFVFAGGATLLTPALRLDDRVCPGPVEVPRPEPRRSS